MNKQAKIFILVGVLILGGVGYFLFQNSQNTPNKVINIQNNQPTQVEEVVASFEYKKASSTEPKVVTVQEGQKVTIKVVSDVADKAHLHGYDMSADVEAGTEASIVFVATKTGRFELELEKLEKKIGVIEIYPR